MIRQVASLTILAGAGILLGAHAMLGAADIAPRLIAVHGLERAATMAHAGTGHVMENLIWTQLRWGAPYLLAGAVLGLVGRFAVVKWSTPITLDSEKSYVTDEAGGRMVMYGLPFVHNPTMPRWAVADVSDVPGIEEASDFEVELLGVYRAGGFPADVVGYHGVSLFDHCAAVWQRAVEQYGPASLESLLALSHDAGKMLTFRRQEDGTWTRISPMHEMNNPEAVRRLPSFWQAPLEERDLILQSLHYMAGTVAAKDVSSDIVTAAQRVKVLDIRTTATEVATRTAGYVNTAAVINAMLQIAADPPIDWNINRTQSSSAPAAGIHLGNGLLLVSDRAIRKALVTHMDAADVAALSLHTPSTNWHSANDLIAEAARTAGIGTRIVLNQATESGWFNVRVGQARMPQALAIQTSASPALIARWGQSAYEIVLAEVRNPNA